VINIGKASANQQAERLKNSKTTAMRTGGAGQLELDRVWGRSEKRVVRRRQPWWVVKKFRISSAVGIEWKTIINPTNEGSESTSYLQTSSCGCVISYIRGRDVLRVCQRG